MFKTKAPREGRFSFANLHMCWLGILLLILGWLEPLHFLPWVSWHNEILTFFSVLLLLAGFVIASKRRGVEYLTIPYVAIVLFALAVVSVIQFGVGRIEFGGDLLVLAFYFFLSFAALVLGLGLGSSSGLDRSHNRVTPVAVYLLVVAAISTVVALFQVFDIWHQFDFIVRTPRLRRPGANIAQPNQLATLLVMGLASLIYLFELRRLNTVSAGALGALLLFGLAVTESRTGILSTLLLSVWWFSRYKIVGSRCTPICVTVGIIAACALFWFWPQLFAFVQAAGLPDALAQVDTSTGTRLIVWPQLFEAVLQKPWFGWGFLGVSKAHNAVLHHYASAESFSYAHNIVLDMAVGMGLPLTLLLVAATAVWLWRRVSSTQSLLPWYCLAVVLPFGVHSMLEFPFAYAYFLAPAMFAVGVLEATLAPSSVVRVGWWPAAVGFSVVTVLMAWSVVEYIAIEEDFRIVRFEAQHVGHTPSDYSRPKIYLLTQLDALLEAGRIVPAPGMAPERIELARKVAMRYPWTATQNRYALSLALNGNPQEAVRQLKVMRAMHGEKTYEVIKADWAELANTKYPQLQALAPL